MLDVVILLLPLSPPQWFFVLLGRWQPGGEPGLRGPEREEHSGGFGEEHEGPSLGRMVGFDLHEAVWRRTYLWPGPHASWLS